MLKKKYVKKCSIRYFALYPQAGARSFISFCLFVVSSLFVCLFVCFLSRVQGLSGVLLFL